MNFYLNKYGFLDPQLTQKPDPQLGIIIVIPCYNEPDLISSLEALDACIPPETKVEVIVVINSSESESKEVLERNRQTTRDFEEWNVSRRYTYHLIHVPELPNKHAGVGLARKIGMDEAVARFDLIGKDGVIVCFDADSRCEINYLTEIEAHFKTHSKSPGCSIYFEHPTEGDAFQPEVYKGIINYELHLRYYKQCLEFCGFPYAFHTVGSSMAVRSSAYQKQGGMNKRKAGEDFYFIHKIIALGNFTELNSTKVIPSPRSSDRVPFGTGRAIQEWLDDDKEEYLTYSFKIFIEIKQFLQQLPDIYESIRIIDEVNVSQEFKLWLVENDFLIALDNAKSNSKGYKSFLKRFYTWFDAFKVLKLVHWMRDHAYQNEGILSQCEALTGIKYADTKTYLEFLRKIDLEMH